MPSKREMLKQRNAENMKNNVQNKSLIDDIITDGEKALVDEHRATSSILEMNPDELVPYSNTKLRLPLHTGEKYARLRESIKINGIMQPVICVHHDKQLMIVAGHNRVAIAKELGIKVPVIIRDDLADGQTDLICIDTNLLNRQPDEFKPSQLAYMLKIKTEAEKHQGVSAKFLPDVGISAQEEYKLSRMQIHRYVKLNDLIDMAMQMVDNKEITIIFGYALSYLPASVQEIVLTEYTGYKFTESDIRSLRTVIDEQSGFEQNDIEITARKYLDELVNLKNEKKNTRKVQHYVSLRQYIPGDIPEQDVEKYIITALLEYKANHE